MIQENDAGGMLHDEVPWNKKLLKYIFSILKLKRITQGLALADPKEVNVLLIASFSTIMHKMFSSRKAEKNQSKQTYQRYKNK